MSSSANRIAPEKPANDASRHCRPDVSQKTCAARHDFAQLTTEEKMTYRKWRRATLIFYSVFVCVLAALSMATNQMVPSTNADNSAAYSPVASAGKQNSR